MPKKEPGCFSRYRYLEAPWSVPVPVRKSSFVALHARHQRHNVEVDLSQIGAFGCARRPVPPEKLLFADLQTNLDINPPLRLGSGRAGFHQGQYLKGVGRTPLAANWNLVNDGYHNSGHLLPSAAIREYLATCYLRARNAGHVVVPCEGLLFRKRAATLSHFERHMVDQHPGKKNRYPEIDRRFQAVSVKPAGFARFSNFTWMLDHSIPSQAFLGNLSILMSAYSRPDAKVPSDLDPEQTIEAFFSGLESGFENALEYSRLGVYWGSFHNNSTLNGRFLDLEVPTFLTTPFFGALVRDSARPPARAQKGLLPFTMGEEPLFYLYAARGFVRHFEQKLAFYCEQSLKLASMEMRWARALRNSLAAARSKSPLFKSNTAAVSRISASIARTFGLSDRKSLSQLHQIISHDAGVLLGHAIPKPLSIKLRKLDLKVNAAELGSQLQPYAPEFVEIPSGGLQSAAWMAELIEDLERRKNIDSLLEGIREAEKNIFLRFSQ